MRIQALTATLDDMGFLDYADAHSRTESAVFHREDVLRLLSLAGQRSAIDVLLKDKMTFFIKLSQDIMEPILEEARERCANLDLLDLFDPDDPELMCACLMENTCA